MNYTYNEDNRMTSLNDWLGTSGNTTDFSYNANSDLTTVTYPSGTSLTDTIAYNTLDQITSVASNTSTEYYGRASNGFQSSFTPNGGTSEPYSYNGSNQVTQGLGQTFNYSSGQEISCLTASNSSSYSCSSQNASYSTDYYYGSQGGTTGPEVGCSLPGTTSQSYCTSPSVSGESLFTYSSIGNRVQSQAFSGSSSTYTAYGYDSQGNLNCIATNATGGTACSGQSSYSSMSYNADGERVTETPQGGSAMTFTWNSVGMAVPRIVADGTNSYIYGPDIFGWGNVPVEQINGTTPQYLESDISGVRIVRNSSGTGLTIKGYTPYGTESLMGSASTTPFGFEGGYEDFNESSTQSGLLYFVHRDYDPATGQFIQVDPAFDVTLQAYAFVGGDPVNASDPSGNSCVTLDAKGTGGMTPQEIAQAEQARNALAQQKGGGFVAISPNDLPNPNSGFPNVTNTCYPQYQQCSPPKPVNAYTCSEALFSLVFGGILTIGGAIWGIATSPTGVGAAIGVSTIAVGAGTIGYSVTDLARGAC